MNIQLLHHRGNCQSNNKRNTFGLLLLLRQEYGLERIPFCRGSHLLAALPDLGGRKTGPHCLAVHFCHRHPVHGLGAYYGSSGGRHAECPSCVKKGPLQGEPRDTPDSTQPWLVGTCCRRLGMAAHLSCHGRRGGNRRPGSVCGEDRDRLGMDYGPVPGLSLRYHVGRCESSWVVQAPNRLVLSGWGRRWLEHCRCRTWENTENCAEMHFPKTNFFPRILGKAWNKYHFRSSKALTKLSLAKCVKNYLEPSARIFFCLH